VIKSPSNPARPDGIVTGQPFTAMSKEIPHGHRTLYRNDPADAHLSFPKIHILVIQRGLPSPVVAQTRFAIRDLIGQNTHSRIADLQGRNDSKRARYGPKDSLSAFV
jgi:hypothetical protein